jgi:hypothetical protein
MPGWRPSGIRTNLRANSLLTGNLAGKIAVLGYAHEAGNRCVAVTIRAFPYEMKQGKVLEEQGISAQEEGIARGVSTYP